MARLRVFTCSAASRSISADERWRLLPITANRVHMPYLQLDVNRSYSVSDKKRLAAAMSETYARMMSVDIRRISVAIRELGDGGVWRIPEVGDEPTPVSMLMLDIRRGRPAELRMEVAKALCQHCIDILGLQEHRLNVEFTQHDGDEMYHPALGGCSPDWKPDEA